jgi:serine/threonine protein kinase
VIKLYSHFESEDNVYLLLEYAPNSNLFTEIKRCGKIEEERAKRYFKDTCEGLKFLHDKAIAHRDLKPENLLLSADDQIQICDFGWSFKGTETRTTFCDTLDYMAPEMLSGRGHSAAVDVWAVGVLLYEMLHGYPPFNAKDERDKTTQISQAEFRCDFYVSRKAVDLISKLLVKNPQDRLTLDEVLAHPWLIAGKYPHKMTETQSEEASDECDILNNIPMWCKSPAKHKSTVLDDEVLSPLNPNDIKQRKLERKVSVQNFEELSQRGSRPSGVFNEIERSSFLCLADKLDKMKTSQNQKPDLINEHMQDDTWIKSDKLPRLREKSANAKPSTRNYAESRQEIEDRLLNFYNSVSENWINRHEGEVVMAPEIEELSLYQTKGQLDSKASSLDESTLSIAPQEPKERSGTGDEKLKWAKKIAAKKRAKQRPLRERDSHETSPESFEPRRSSKDYSDKPIPRKNRGGFFTWLGSILGCSERY